MKKLVLIGIVFSFVASLAFAQEATPTAINPETPATQITLKGDIIDNMCAGTKTQLELSEFIKTHTKQCALMPNCVESGYSIFTDGALYKFDKESNAKIQEFLRRDESRLQVVITAEKVGDELNLVAIENQM